MRSAIALVGRHLFRRQRIEVAGGEQRDQRGDIEDRGADQRAREVEGVVVKRLDLATRAALLEERPAYAQEPLGGGEETLRRALLCLGRVAQDQTGERGARHDRVHPDLYGPLDARCDRGRHRKRLVEARDERAEDVLDHGVVERLLVAEVVEERGPLHAHRLGHVLEAGAREAAPGEQALGGREDGGSRPLGLRRESGRGYGHELSFALILLTCK